MVAMSELEAHSESEATPDTDVGVTPEEYAEMRAKLAEVRRKNEEAQAEGKLNRGSKDRRAAEHKQRKERVNSKLLHGHGVGRDERWSIRTRPDLIKRVKKLADKLSEPKAKVSVAALMEEAMEMLLAKYGEGTSDA
jgi:hypothetical protein